MRSRERPHLRPGHLLRFSVGLESADALILDLGQAMAQHLPKID
jgi:cystathionine beta-lyase/cystathionine gamma-synthase